MHIIDPRPTEFTTYCPVCQASTPFKINPKHDGTAACMGCAIVYVIAILVIIAKAREKLGIGTEPVDPQAPNLIDPAG